MNTAAAIHKDITAYIQLFSFPGAGRRLEVGRGLVGGWPGGVYARDAPGCLVDANAHKGNLKGAHNSWVGKGYVHSVRPKK